jgi:dipeptidyl aminopeptidase/acylaminoacyl peptidase
MTQPSLVLPYGSWPSPITAADVARGGIRLGFPVLIDAAELGGVPDVWWTEGRPDEGGRQVVVSALYGDLLPAPFYARTRVHEYGGACWLPLPAQGSGRPDLVFSEWTDQRLYRLATDDARVGGVAGAAPRPLTPAPAEPAALRYADLVLSPDGLEVWCVREEHAGEGPAAEVTRAIVAVPLDGSAADDPTAIRVVATGSQFFAFPRPSDDGRRLAWVAWNHPDMPWDATELRVGELADGVVSSSHAVLGGPGESVLEPEWADADRLYVVSDRSGWWNLYLVAATGAEPPRPLAPRDEEFSGPLWQLGYRHYGVLDDQRLLVVHGAGELALGVLDPASGALVDLDLPFTDWHPSLRVLGTTAVGVAASASTPAAVVRIDLSTGGYEVLRSAADDIPDAAYLPQPQSPVFEGLGGRNVHAHVYPPRNPDVRAPDDELPPYVVFVHGGPTADSPAVLDLEIAYFTSRGLGVIDVEYGGSTGYGREYRERLRGQWGVVDVEDCVSAAQALAKAGQADGARLAIRGGSAGGWTTLAALTRTTAFAAGTSYYGVAELLHFVSDTHDFESRYVDGMVGPLPEARDLYVERAPLTHVDDVSCPVLLLQGLEDAIVPPSQAEMFRDALVAKGIRHAYIAFEGEQHGFRKAENVIASLEAELSFYGQVFGFTPPGVPVLQLS